MMIPTIFTLTIIPETEMNTSRCFLRLIGGLALSALAFTTTAAELRTENTYELGEGEARPEASLENASWLVGSWTGTAFGKNFEEHWNPATADSMVGLFKLYDDEEGVSFYELLLLTVEEGSLSLKVKHFNSDFTAWEDKGDFVNFKLVKMEVDALHFGGLSFYRRDENHIDGYIVMKKGEELSEHHLVYTRSNH
jgi:hypothetical protein